MCENGRQAFSVLDLVPLEHNPSFVLAFCGWEFRVFFRGEAKKPSKVGVFALFECAVACGFILAYLRGIPSAQLRKLFPFSIKRLLRERIVPQLGRA